ncbi:MAG: PH domain-containing protein [Muribaculaceae bacterium]|nr:PH domain-containing protein [Muribaculaceae bacterium]
MSKFIEKTLEDGEQIIFKGRLHWTFNWKYTFGGGLLAILGFVMLIIGLTRPETVFTVFGTIGLIIGAGFMVWGYFIRSKTTFAVTTHRFIQKDGILSIKMTEIPLFKIETVNLYQGVLQRIFNTGSIELVGSGGTNHKVDYIQEPFDVRKILTTRMKATHDQSQD